jgi:hypothetical protein
MDINYEKQRYIAAAITALGKQNWNQLISICEHILRLEDDKCQDLKSD